MLLMPMIPIFNSVGSNYSFRFALKAFCQLFVLNNQQAEIKLIKKLETEFKGKAYLFYKGRQAIEFCLKSLSIQPDDGVLTQAFSCYAIEEAILKSQAQPIFFDIEKNRLKPSLATLQAAYKRAKKPRALIIQNTLGINNNMEEISKWCKQMGLYLIEDLAQSYGAKNLGQFGDAVILSFGKDKILDTVSGGACIIKIIHQPPEIKGSVSCLIQLKDLSYPLLTYKIRVLYPIGFGKIIHYLIKKTGWEINPNLNPVQNLSKLPNRYAILVLGNFSHLDNDLIHRRQIARIYFQSFKLQTIIDETDIDKGANLRFPLLVLKPSHIIKYLKNYNIYISDRWYKSPVDCGNLNYHSTYQFGSCPNAETLSRQIINLPTHRYITETKAKQIVRLIKNA